MRQAGERIPQAADGVGPVDAPVGNFAVLRNSSFAWFLTGTTLSNAAQWIQMTLMLAGIVGAIAIGVFLGSRTIREYRLSQALKSAEA